MILLIFYDWDNSHFLTLIIAKFALEKVLGGALIADPSIWSRKGVTALECTRDIGFLMELEGTFSLEWLSVAPMPFSLSAILDSQLAISVIYFMLRKLLPFWRNGC